MHPFVRLFLYGCDFVESEEQISVCLNFREKGSSNFAHEILKEFHCKNST